MRLYLLLPKPKHYFTVLIKDKPTILKRFLTISFTFILLLGVLAEAKATTGEKEEKSQDKNQQQPKEQTLPKMEEAQGGLSQAKPVQTLQVDTSRESSFEKFNFIFYFLYKHKYESDGSFENGDVRLLEAK